jgi:hypothetical protein
VRVSTAFNKMSAIPGTAVTGVEFAPTGVVVSLRRRSKKLRCPACGHAARAAYDRSTRRWRHLDLGPRSSISRRRSAGSSARAAARL